VAKPKKTDEEDGEDEGVKPLVRENPSGPPAISTMSDDDEEPGRDEGDEEDGSGSHHA
jgi:hypothetical protein